MDIVGIPIITTAVLGLMEIYKKLVAGSKAYDKLCAIIPIIACIIGAGFGILLFFLVPDYIPSATYGTAIVMGAASGLSATGCNQIIKQISKTSFSED